MVIPRLVPVHFSFHLLNANLLQEPSPRRILWAPLAPSWGSGKEWWMRSDESAVAFARGLDLLKRNRLTESANAFRLAFKKEPGNPRYLSYYGLIVALAEDNLQDGINFCRAAIHRVSYEPDFFINLSKVYSKAGQRKKALEALVEGLNFDKNEARIIMEMKRIGVRRRPSLRFLPRNHILNKTLGKLTYKFRKGRSFHRPH
jgi:predicted Zn-dependent protease